MQNREFKKNTFVFLTFVFLTLFIFRPIFNGLVPFSANLLVSTYNPWAKEKFFGWEAGIPNKPVGNDDLKIFYPQRNFTLTMLSLGEIPLWNPYSFSGVYHIGLSETAVFYPIFLLLSFLPQITAWTVFVVIQPVIIFAGMYLYLRLIIKDWKSAFFGAVVFAFSGIAVTRFEEGISAGHALIWLPFVFYGVEGYFREYKLRYLFFTLFFLSSSLLAGWFQFTFYIFVFSFIYGLFRIICFNKGSNKRNLVFLPFALVPLVTLFHIIPACESLLDSLRGTQSEQNFLISSHLMPFSHILTYIFPDFWGNPGSYNFFGRSMYGSTLYIGVTPFIFSLFSLFGFKKNKLIQFFFIAAVVTLLLGLDTWLTRLILNMPIPIVSTFIPNRIFLITSFSLSVLAAFGMSRLHIMYKKIPIKYTILILGSIGILVIAVNVYVIASLVLQGISFHQLRNSLDVCSQVGTGNKTCQLIVQTRNVLLPNVLFIITVLLVLLRNKFAPTIFFLLITGITFFGQSYFSDKSLAFSRPEFVFPKHPVFSYLQHVGIDRFVSLDEAYISANFPLMYRVFSPDGVGSMYPKRYSYLLKYVHAKGKVGGEASRVEAKISPSSKLLFESQNPYLLRFMQIDGIKYIVKHKLDKEKFVASESAIFPLTWENDTWQIFSYRDARPRFFWTNNYEVITDENKILDRLFDPKFNPQHLILETSPGFVPISDAKGDVKLISYTPNSVVFQTDSSQKGLLYLSDNYSSSFNILVDNKESNLLRANYSFRAVVIPAGKHIIKMYYRSDRVFYGFIISASTIAICFIMALCYQKRKLLTI